MGGDCSQKLLPRRRILTPLRGAAQPQINTLPQDRTRPPLASLFPSGAVLGARGRGDSSHRALASAPTRLSYRLPGSFLGKQRLVTSRERRSEALVPVQQRFQQLFPVPASIHCPDPSAL